MSEEIFMPLSRVVRGCRRFVWVCAGVVLFFGVINFIGWMFGIPVFRNIIGDIKPRTNTSFCLILGGLALLGLLPQESRIQRWFVRSLGAVIFLFGFLTVLEYAFDINLHIDEMLAKDDPSAASLFKYNRMGPAAALNFTLIGAAFWCLTVRRTAHVIAGQMMAIAAMLITLMPLLGYLYIADKMFVFTHYTAVAWSTALSQLVLALGMLLAHVDRGLMRPVVMDDPGGMLLRRAVWPMLLFVVIVGFLVASGERASLYDAPMGMALFVMALITMTFLMIYGIARSLSRFAVDNRRHRQMLAVTLTSVGEGVIATDSDGRITYMNREAERLTGWTLTMADGLPLQKVFRVLSERTRQPMESPVEKVLRLGTIVTLSDPTLLVAKNGGETPIDNSAAPLRTPDGRILGVVVNFRDFSERRLVQVALEQSEKRYHELVERMPQALCISRGNHVIYANAATTKLLGLSVEEIRGKTPESLLSPDDPAAIAQRLAFLDQGQPVESFEKRIAAHDGHLRAVEITAIPFTDADGACIQWVLRDVTDRNHAAEALKQAKTAAEQANAAKDHFLAVLSHELRTPLTPALMSASILLRNKSLDAEIHNMISLIHRNIEMEARLVDDLLDVTRITQGKIELHNTKVPLNNTLTHAIEVCQSAIASKRLELRVDLPAISPVVWGDATRLQQIFWNLLRNAVKFTSEGGHIQVRCMAGADDRFVVVEIQDDGLGIEPEMMPKIFGAFEQGAHRVTRQFGGMGLGLAISRTMAELHGGMIEAESGGRNRGSIFRVRLPMYIREAAPQAETPAPPPEIRHQNGMLQILLVEDHQDTANVMLRLLEAEGYTVTVAGTVAAAIDLVDKYHFDLLLSDLGLPDGSGHDLLRTLRERGVAMPAIALSGYGQQSDIARSDAVGFAGHLVKPVVPQQLIQAIESVMAVPK